MKKEKNSSASADIPSKVMLLSDYETIEKALNELPKSKRESAVSALAITSHCNLKDMSKKANDFSSRISKLESQGTALRARLNMIEPHKVEKALDNIKSDVWRLHDITQQLVLKITGVTEASWIIGRLCTRTEGKESDRWKTWVSDADRHELNAAAIKAMDYPGGWWREYGRRPLNELVAAMMSASRNGLEDRWLEQQEEAAIPETFDPEHLSEDDAW